MERKMIKDVLVHLDGSEEDEHRLRHAEGVATGFAARLTGLFTNPLPDLAAVLPIDGGAAAAQIIAELGDEARRQGDVIEQRLAERFARIGLPNEVRRIELISGEMIHRVASEARWSDLFVMSRPYEGNGGGIWDRVFEAALFESGRGIYLVPPGSAPRDGIRRILVAWRDTRETARAVAEAMPFIERSGRTALVLVEAETGARDEKREPEMDVARYLDRHGTKVEIEILESDGRPVSDVVLDQARRMSAELIVMGGYGHSRAREWVLGGVTVEMLERSEFPILIAH
jgi:nucleotide-binding universal stress UspA family protein